MSVKKAAEAAAITRVLTEYQKLADEERTAAPRRAMAQQKIDAQLEMLKGMKIFDETKITADMQAAFIMFRPQLEMQAMIGQFDPALYESMSAHIESAVTDPQRFTLLEKKLNDYASDLRPPRLPAGETLFAVAVNEPPKGFGTWTLSFVALKVDEGYHVTVAEKLEFDLDVMMEVSPATSLSDRFNVPGKRYRAGQPFAPFTITHRTLEGDQQTMLDIKGHVFQDGERIGEIRMPPLPLFRPTEMAINMEALLRTLEVGPGPSGPN